MAARTTGVVRTARTTGPARTARTARTARRTAGTARRTRCTGARGATECAAELECIFAGKYEGRRGGGLTGGLVDYAEHAAQAEFAPPTAVSWIEGFESHMSLAKVLAEESRKQGDLLRRKIEEDVVFRDWLLVKAAGSGDISLCASLLQLGVTPRAQGEALVFACSFARAGVVRFLLEACPPGPLAYVAGFGAAVGGGDCETVALFLDGTIPKAVWRVAWQAAARQASNPRVYELLTFHGHIQGFAPVPPGDG